MERILFRLRLILKGWRQNVKFLQTDKLWLSSFKYGVIPETAVFQYGCCFVKCKGDFIRRVGICADCDNFSSKFPVATDHSGAGVGFSQSVMIASCIDFDACIFMDQSTQDFIKYILIAFIAVITILIGTVPYNIVNMTIDIYIGKDTEVFQDRFKIFPVAVRFPSILKKLAVIRITAMDYMGRTDYKIKRIQSHFLIKSLLQMRLKSVFDSEIYSDMPPVFFL